MNIKKTVVGYVAAAGAIIVPSTSFATVSGTVLNAYKTTKVCRDISCVRFGQIDFLPTSGVLPVTVGTTSITGYAWGGDMGWINFAPTGGGVLYSTTTGELSGYAWAQSSGWINFRPTNSGTLSMGVPVGVSILPTGEWNGWAFVSGVQGGWLKFDCSSGATCIKSISDIVPPPVVTPPTQTTSGGAIYPTLPSPTSEPQKETSKPVVVTPPVAPPEDVLPPPPQDTTALPVVAEKPLVKETQKPDTPTEPLSIFTPLTPVLTDLNTEERFGGSKSNTSTLGGQSRGFFSSVVETFSNIGLPSFFERSDPPVDASTVVVQRPMPGLGEILSTYTARIFSLKRVNEVSFSLSIESPQKNIRNPKPAFIGAFIDAVSLMWYKVWQ